MQPSSTQLRKQSRQSDAQHTRTKSRHANASNQIYSVWPAVTTSKREKANTIMVMRGGERLDRVFGSGWQRSEVVAGRYLYTDLNIPYHIKSIPPSWMLHNSPITSVGKATCQLLARALHNVGLKPQLIICSPMLRAIESASAMANFFGLNFGVEPGLLEPLAWFRASSVPLPVYEIAALRSHYLMLSINYQPLLSMEKMCTAYATESEADGVRRQELILKTLGSTNRVGPILIVGHAITMDIAESFAKHGIQATSQEKSLADWPPLQPHMHDETVSHTVTSTQAGIQHDSQAGQSRTQIQMSPASASHIAECYSIDKRIEIGLKFPPSSILTMTQAAGGNGDEKGALRLHHWVAPVTSGLFSSELATA